MLKTEKSPGCSGNRLSERLMLRLLLVIAVFAALWWFLLRFSRVSTPQQKQMLGKLVLYGLGGLLLLLVVTGRAPWFFALLGLAIPWLQRFLTLHQAWRVFKRPGKSSPSSGQYSTVRSGFLEMRLDHDSGEMNGLVLKGEREGQFLDDLEQQQLLDLLSQFNQDTDSQNLLMAYLDFRFTDQWREQAGGARPGNQSSPVSMTRAEAFAVLGVDEQASDDEISTAHKKLMQSLHPDRGGSEYLASKINQARDMLLG